ncbi:MAG: tetratricopeptide repeat protein, partial [Verrucomicrobiales bacterium]
RRLNVVEAPDCGQECQGDVAVAGIPDDVGDLDGAGSSNAVESAAYHYAAALAHRPEFPEAHRSLGNPSLLRKDWPAAAGNYESALALEPDDPATHYALGDTYRKMSQFDKAAAQYREVLRINPQHLDTRIKLADSLAEAGHREDAIAAAREALAMARAAKNDRLIAVLEARLRDYEQP